MSELRPLRLCPFCKPPHWSRRLGSHIRYKHPEKVATMFMSDGRLNNSGRIKPKMLEKELDSMPKAMIEIRR